MRSQDRISYKALEPQSSTRSHSITCRVWAWLICRQAPAAPLAYGSNVRLWTSQISSSRWTKERWNITCCSTRADRAINWLLKFPLVNLSLRSATEKTRAGQSTTLPYRAKITTPANRAIKNRRNRTTATPTYRAGLLGWAKECPNISLRRKILISCYRWSMSSLTTPLANLRLYFHLPVGRRASIRPIL